jgi:hypothetical protein
MSLILLPTLLEKFENEFTLRTQSNNVALYSSNVRLINSLARKLKAEITYVKPRELYDKSVVYHVNPKHSIRVYFNNKLLDATVATEFKKLLKTYAFTCGPGLKKSLKRGSVWTSAYLPASNSSSGSNLLLMSNHYVDFDDEALITILALHTTEIIRKVCRIEKK